MPLCPVCQSTISADAQFCHRHAGLRTPQARAAAARRREVASLVALLGSKSAAARQLGVTRWAIDNILKRKEELDAQR
jgi:predicted nucleic acid-binding Zn ribbon protein